MKSPLQVTGIDHVVFHVKDLARSKKFYIDFLGMDIEHESSWQCFLKCGSQGLALFEAEDDADIHGGSEVNHMALQLVSGDYQRVKSHWKTPVSKSPAAKEIQPAFISPIRTAIACNS